MTRTLGVISPQSDFAASGSLLKSQPACFPANGSAISDPLGIWFQSESVMRMQMFQSIILGLALLTAGGGAYAQDPQWAAKMFDKLDQDFGVVPSGADLKYRLKITNKYQQTVHIAGVASSCGCTAAKPARDT